MRSYVPRSPYVPNTSASPSQLVLFNAIRDSLQYQHYVRNAKPMHATHTQLEVGQRVKVLRLTWHDHKNKVDSHWVGPGHVVSVNAQMGSVLVELGGATKSVLQSACKPYVVDGDPAPANEIIPPAPSNDIIPTTDVDVDATPAPTHVPAPPPVPSGARPRGSSGVSAPPRRVRQAPVPRPRLHQVGLQQVPTEKVHTTLHGGALQGSAASAGCPPQGGRDGP